MVCGGLEGMIKIAQHHFLDLEEKPRTEDCFRGLDEFISSYFRSLMNNSTSSKDRDKKGAGRKRKIKVEPELMGSSQGPESREEVQELMQSARNMLVRIRGESKQIIDKVRKGEVKLGPEVDSEEEEVERENVLDISVEETGNNASQKATRKSRRKKPATHTTARKTESMFEPWHVFDEDDRQPLDEVTMEEVEERNKRVRVK